MGRDCKPTFSRNGGFKLVESLIVDYFGVKQFLAYVGIYIELNGTCKGNLLIIEYESLWTKVLLGPERSTISI